MILKKINYFETGKSVTKYIEVVTCPQQHLRSSKPPPEDASFLRWFQLS